jgi:uncharacterized protein (TIGR03437 family)
VSAVVSGGSLLLSFRAALLALTLVSLAPLHVRAADLPPRNSAEPLFVSDVAFPIGGSAVDFAVDSAGAIYVAGTILQRTPGSLKPASNGRSKSEADPGSVEIPCGPFPPARHDVFVAKVAPDGHQLLFMKLFGGSRDDQAAAIALDNAGGAVITGFTESRDFPGIEAPAATQNLGREVFVLELNADGSLLRSTLLGGDDRDEPHDIAIDSTNAIYISGETVSPDFPALNSLPRNPEKGGMLRSENGGVTWSDANAGLVERRIRAILPDPRQDSVVYAVTNAGIFRSGDGGSDWQAASQALLPEVALSLATDPQDSATLYAGTENGVFKTVDAGATWFSLRGDLPDPALRITHVVVDPASRSTIYVATGAGPYKSSDGGQTWKALQGPGETRVLMLDPRDSSTLYVSQYFPGSCGFFGFPPNSTLDKSTDGGATFTSILGDLAPATISSFMPLIRGLVLSSADSENLFVATSGGVFRTNDGGVHWIASNEGLPDSPFAPGAPAEVLALVSDPLQPSRLYALLSSVTAGPGEVFVSNDAAATWQRIDFGGEAAHISALAVDPKNSARLYAGTFEQPDQDGFVAKLAPNSRSLEFSTILGGKGVDSALFVTSDGSGHALVGGTTQSDDFPVAGALQARRAGEDDLFVAKIAVDGASLVYSTFLGGSQSDFLHGLELDRDDSVILAGQTLSADFPVHNDIRSHLSGPSDAFVTKLSADGSSLVYSGFLGGFGEDGATGMALAPGGQVYLTGVTGSGNFPVTDLGAGCNRIGFLNQVPFLTKLDAAGARIEQSIRLSDSVRDYTLALGIFAQAPQNAFLLIQGETVYSRGQPGSQNRFGYLHIEKFDLSAAAPAFTANCVVNAASLISGPVAPGEIVTIYGNGMGPEEFVASQPDPAGKLPFELDGAKVLFDGEPGALLHVQSNQISAVAPLSVAGKSALLVEVERNGQRSAAVRWLASAAHPGIFTQDFSGLGPAVYNEDWTLNSYENPAHPGSVVTVFLNGGGMTNPQVDPAGVAPLDAPLARLNLPVTAALDSFPAAVEYAGTAPGKSHGVMQVNVRIPADIRQKTSQRDFRMVIAVDGLLSQAVMLIVD